MKASFQKLSFFSEMHYQEKMKILFRIVLLFHQFF